MRNFAIKILRVRLTMPISAGRNSISTSFAKSFNLCLFIAVVILFNSPGFSQSASKGTENCTADVTDTSILKGLSVEKTLRISGLQVTCIPVPEFTKEGYHYDPYNGIKFQTDLKNSSGEMINSFVWYGKKRFPGEVIMSRYEIVGGVNALKELSAGNYQLEFKLGTRLIKTFPFSVGTKMSSDPYNPGTIYLLDGGWRDRGTFLLGGLNGSMCFSFMLRASRELAAIKPPEVAYNLSLIRDGDRKLIGEEKSNKLRLRIDWQDYRLCFQSPNRKPGDPMLRLSDIASTDGSYTIKLTVDKKPYASYKLIVKNGKIDGREIPTKGYAQPVYLKATKEFSGTW